MRWESLEGIVLAGVGVEVGEEGGELVLDIGVWVEGTEMGGRGWDEDEAGILEEAEWVTRGDADWATGGDSGVK